MKLCLELIQDPENDLDLSDSTKEFVGEDFLRFGLDKGKKS